MNAFYEVVASSKFVNVQCPKHRNYMKELRNGLLGENLWWCFQCEKPYYLRPTALREGQWNKEAVAEQLKKEQS